MSNEVTDTTADQMSDTPMDSPAKLEKGKGKMPLTEQDPMGDDDSSEEDTEVYLSCAAMGRLDANYIHRPKARQKVS